VDEQTDTVQVSSLPTSPPAPCTWTPLSAEAANQVQAASIETLYGVLKSVTKNLFFGTNYTNRALFQFVLSCHVAFVGERCVQFGLSFFAH
jgi:hypothetical protein